MTLLYPQLPNKRGLLKNMRYRLSHSHAKHNLNEQMILANACLHKDNISSVQPYWQIRNQTDSPLIDLCLFISCARQAHSRTAKNKVKSMR
jgi:hypothetical protein